MGRPTSLSRRAGPCSLLSLLLLLSASSWAWAEERQGSVVDKETGAPIAGATITSGDQIAVSDAEGKFRIEAAGPTLRARASGYGRIEADLEDGDSQTLALAPLQTEGLYLTVYGIGAPGLRNPALEVMKAAGLNTLVFDVKGDRGLIPYASKVPLAVEIGATKVRTIGNLPGLLAQLKAREIYTIGRIVVFKDTLLAQARPQWAIKNANGSLWHDREGLAWIDPFQTAAQDYVISVAEEAAAAGFDEIQFDYVRFPDATGVVLAKTSTQPDRVAAITGFLRNARQHLQPYNVFTSADIFGYVAWNTNDTFIGQKLEELSGAVDYLSPMLYPSGFQFGIPGHRNPVLSPYNIVYDTLKEAMRRTAGSPVRYRPWLQGFPDYAFDRRKFGTAEISAQIKGADRAGAIGWMLWNPRNVYSTDGLMPEESSRR